MGDLADTAARGRPRSESARRAVLEAVDDLLVEVGYAAMTMKSIAERAGVGRQTVYRWWSTKAEILVEACAADAREDLATTPRKEPAADLLAYLNALNDFLYTDAGLAYRALVGEAQHDPDVHTLVSQGEIVERSARAVLDRIRPHVSQLPDARLAVAQLVGPVLSHVLTNGARLTTRQLSSHAQGLLRAWGADEHVR